MLGCNNGRGGVNTIAHNYYNHNIKIQLLTAIITGHEYISITLILHHNYTNWMQSLASNWSVD